MTIWENIFKDYQKSGKTWGSLAEEIHPLFIKFLKRSDIKLKSVLDIGCGTGNYLKLLQNGGFTVAGIDSSLTAVKLTKRILGKDALVQCVEMFEFTIPKNKYDLIISLSTINHGTKGQIKKLIKRIHKAIVDNGKIFMTLPDIESSKKWNTFKEYKKIADGTFIPLLGPEKGLVHSFYTKKEIQILFSDFQKLQIELDNRGRWAISGVK